MKKTLVLNIIMDIFSVLFRGLPKTIAKKIADDSLVKRLSKLANLAINKLQNVIKLKLDFLKKNNFI